MKKWTSLSRHSFVTIGRVTTAVEQKPVLKKQTYAWAAGALAGAGVVIAAKLLGDNAAALAVGLLTTAFAGYVSFWSRIHPNQRGRHLRGVQRIGASLGLAPHLPAHRGAERLPRAVRKLERLLPQVLEPRGAAR
jgi:hypothetical protein